jgi:uncharacterized RDD family membrane protein YckC/ribosomal protein L40E
MRCQQCQAESSPGARYCHSCGQQLQPRCATCDTLNPAGSNFCFSCGSRLAAEERSSSTETAAEFATTAPNAPVCLRCYERNEPGSAYCYACGLPLDDGVSPVNARAGHIAAFALGRPAGFWIRVLAYIMDGILLTVAFALVWPIISGEAITDYWQSTDAFAAGDFFSLALNLVYYTGAIAIWSTTLGKRPFRLYVVRTDGSRVSAARALARYLAYFLSAFTLGIGFIMVGLRQDKRGLHDLVCDTVVIQR